MEKRTRTEVDTEKGGKVLAVMDHILACVGAELGSLNRLFFIKSGHVYSKNTNG
jgi:hypothetical protein